MAPLSYAQKRLWFLHRSDPDDTSHNNGLVLRLRGELDAGALRVAVDAAVARHESLRTSFADVGGGPVTVVRPARAVPVERIDLSVAADAGELARWLVADRVGAPFDLAAAPPLRISVLTLGRDDHVLCLVAHRIIADETSLDVLFDDLLTLYRRLGPAAPPVPYGDVARWEPAPGAARRVTPEHERRRPAGAGQDGAEQDGAGQDGAATVPALFERAVGADPRATALLCGDERVSYGDLDHRVALLAAALRRRGVAEGCLVGVCLRPSAGAVAAMLAVWRAGAAYLPLDPDHPDERLAFLIVDSGPRLVVTDDRLARRLPPGTVALVPAGNSGSGDDRWLGGWAEVSAADPAYVIYPAADPFRAVPVRHGDLAARVRRRREAYGIRREHRVVQLASPGDDAHAEELYPALTAGASVLLLPCGRTEMSGAQAGDRPPLTGTCRHAEPAIPAPARL
ncbi:MAG TPA: condensation domain-containing protein [Nonomuraea sp.]|nr:condensation domain-containing protein [Nonomuraea sp.]